MRVPESLTVQVVCEGEHDLSGLIAVMTVRAGRKNAYHIYFPMTDSIGSAVLTACDFRGQFEDHWEQGLMDCDGTIDSASQYVKLALFDVAQLRNNLDAALAWPLLKNEREMWSSRREQVEYFLSCRNELFETVPTFRYPEVPDSGLLRLKVRPRQ